MSGNVRRIGMSLRDVKARIMSAGVVAAQATAARVAPTLNSLARSAFAAGNTVYGEARPAGKRGSVSLVRTGRMRDSIAFTAIGATVRAALGVAYARYHVGRYRILPSGDRTVLPVAWARAIDAVFRDAMRKAAA